MILSTDIIQLLKITPNSAYELIKTEFLYHSNKIEGSTFTKENLEKFLQENIIEGTHEVDDIYETINSTKLFDFVVDTLQEPLNKRLIQEYHRLLKEHTTDHERGWAGSWKKIPNMISGTDLKLAQPWEVDQKIDDLLTVWESSKKEFEDVIEFHAKFENIHPFQDGNGRVGRFIMLKQCIENEMDLILIDDMFSDDYKRALNKAQTKNDYSELTSILHECQKRLDDKLIFLKETIEYLEEHNVQNQISM